MKNDRKFELILYPDSNSYNCDDVIYKASKYFDYWAYILHDKDVCEDGSPKKPHYHFIGKKDTMMTPSGICYQLGIQDTSLANIFNWKSAVKYLIHVEQTDKYPYDPNEVTSNFDTDKILKGSETDDSQAKRILEHIINNPNITTKQLTIWVLDNGLWSGFRRGFAVWDRILGGSYNESRRNSQSRF